MLGRIGDGAAVVLGLKPLKTADAAKPLRTKVIAALLLLVFWLPSGGVAVPSLIAYLGRVDISLDGLFRAVPVAATDSRQTIPVTIVDIDEGTWKEWLSPPATPRDRLAAIVDRVVRAGAVAVVPDIDLSGDAGAAPGSDAFLDYLRNYPASAAPILLPKRIDADSGRPAPSHYDGIVTHDDPRLSARPHPNLVWVDAALESEGDGVIRRWPLWREVCVGGGTLVMQSVAAGAITAAAAARIVDLPPLQRPAPSADCTADAGDARPRVLVRSNPGRRHVTGSGVTSIAGTAGGSLISVPARLVAGSQAQLDDAALFRGRVVFIGASHAASRDFHRTVYGDLPGVEVWAQQVHLAPLQDLQSASHGFGFKLAVTLLFVLLVAVELVLKRLKTLTQVLLLLAAAGIGVRMLRYLATYEAIGTAVLLMVALVGFRAVGRMIEDWNRIRGEQPRLGLPATFKRYMLEGRPRKAGEG